MRRIYEWYAGPDRLSLRAIAQKLTALGLPTWRDLRTPGKGKSRGYAQWTRSRVRELLKREVYAGVWHFGKRKVLTVRDDQGRERMRGVTNPRESWIPVNVPPLVDRATWDKAQSRLDENKNNALR